MLFQDILMVAATQGGGLAFTPASLSPTAWYDPSDISTLFQDSAGTTPVTASGDPVGKMNDKSGNGIHLTQATAAARPIYTVAAALKYLVFDGVDDFMQSANEPFGTSIAEASVMIAHREISRVAGGLFGLTNGGVAAASWRALAPFSDGTIYFDVGGFSAPNRITATAPAVATDIVFLFENSVANARQLLTVDGAGGASDATGHTVNSTALPMTLGTAGGNFQNTRFSGAVIKAGAVYTAGEVASLLTYLGAKQGRAL